MDFLFGFAMIVCCGGSLMLALAIYQNKHLTKQLERKEKECVGHQDIIAQWEQKCLQLTKQLEQKEQDCAGYQDIIARGEQRLLAKLKKYRRNS
ncbi:hypothetical protein [Bartonella grahamii]|uniref:hypothetical protein n=1 Tax=Bartonella grahamii TaxID=33045 RepID=UPI00235EC35F|nr:hypothetical protein [Bartonella grahamii]